MENTEFYKLYYSLYQIGKKKRKKKENEKLEVWITILGNLINIQIC